MRSGGQGGPQARARLRALSLTAVSPPASSIRSKKADLVLDTQHGIYRVRVKPGQGPDGPATVFIPAGRGE